MRTLSSVAAGAAMWTSLPSSAGSGSPNGRSTDRAVRRTSAAASVCLTVEPSLMNSSTTPPSRNASPNTVLKRPLPPLDGFGAGSVVTSASCSRSS